MENSQHFDLTDLLIGIGIFANFIAFGVCMWLIKREMNKKKANQKGADK